MRASGLLVCLAGAAALWRPAFVQPPPAPRRLPRSRAEVRSGPAEAPCQVAAAGGTGTRRRLLAGLLSGAAAAVVGGQVVSAQERADRPAMRISRPDGMRTAPSGADQGYIDHVARARIEASQWRETQAEALMHRAMLKQAPTKEERVRRNQKTLERSAQLRKLLTASPAES